MSFVALANITLGSSASSVTFSSIPNTFRDLVLVGAGGSSAAENVLVRLNGDSGSNYSFVQMSGFSGGTSSSAATTTVFVVGNFQNTQNSFTCQFMDYSATDKHKTALARYSQDSSTTAAFANRWANTGAVTSIQVFTGSTFNVGSTFALYGIAS